jgi:hypothetical protein
MQAHDPQVPYWWTLDLDTLGVFDGAIQLALLHALAVVTICRGGTYQADLADAVAIVDRTLDVLPLAVDAAIERLMEEGADEATIDIWQQVRSRLLDREGAVELAEQFGMLSVRR